jgi:hypothetical protein
LQSQEGQTCLWDGFYCSGRAKDDDDMI